MSHDEPEIKHLDGQARDGQARAHEIERMRRLIRHIEQRADDLLSAANNSKASQADGIVAKAEKLQKAAQALKDEAERLKN